MPVVREDEDAPPIAIPNTVEVAAPEFRSVTVDTRYTPSATLLTHVEGSSWTVDYFSQILTSDSAAQGQQSTLDPLYQQYRRIKGFEFKVTQPLTTAQDTDTMTMKTTGGANIYPFLIPNVGDMFIADVGDGREGLFKVTRSERRSIFKDTCYAVDYELISFADPDTTGDLYSKVQETLQFVRDFLMHGQNPLLLEEDFVVVRKLADRYHELAQVYFRTMNSRQYRTLMVPGQEYPTYDPFLAANITKWFSTWDAQELRAVRVLNVDGDPAMETYTLWSVLHSRTARHLKLAAKKMGMVSARTFERNPMMEGIFWSGVDRVVYPKDPTATVDFEQLAIEKPLLEASFVPESSSVADVVEPVLDFPAGSPYNGAPLLKAVLTDDHYVFSQAFYTRAATGQSKFELAVWDYLDEKALNNKLLLALCDTAYTWGPLEKFYYLPILLLLIKASIRYL